jgi:nitrogen-specific signal transduction histidine kinase
MSDKPVVTVDLERLATVIAKIAHVKHEINNPLMGILGHADLIAHDPGVSEEVRIKAQVIVNETRRVADLVRTLEDLRGEIVDLGSLSPRRNDQAP